MNAPASAMPGAAVPTAFELSRVTYRYDSTVALDDLSLAIRQGKRTVLLGANGSGKSTLLRLLDALHFPVSGTISFQGAPIPESAFDDPSFAFDYRRRVGLVFQDPGVQLFNPTVFDEVAFAPLQLEWPKDEILRRVSETLDQMQLTHLK